MNGYAIAGGQQQQYQQSQPFGSGRRSGAGAGHGDVQEFIMDVTLEELFAGETKVRSVGFSIKKRKT